MRTISLLVIILSVALLGDIVAGTIGLASSGGSGTSSSCPTSPASPCLTNIQSGTQSCTIGASSQQCSNTVTFNPAYSTAPLVSTGSSQAGVPLSGSISVGPSPFLSTSPAQAWISMPFTQAELFGTATQRIRIDTRSGIQIAGFQAECSTASNTAGAYLMIQVSIDAITWINITSTKILIDNTQCPGLSTTGAITPIGFVGALAVSALWFRVVGGNGGGVGDNPSFTSIIMNMNVFIQGSNCSNVSSLTVTTLVYNCFLPFKPSVATVVSSRWFAGIAT